jgi:type IV secretory pathway VirB2 component (pilin)
VSWGMAMIVGVGVAIVFGSTAIVRLLGGTTGAAAAATGHTNCS